MKIIEFKLKSPIRTVLEVSKHTVFKKIKSVEGELSVIAVAPDLCVDPVTVFIEGVTTKDGTLVPEGSVYIDAITNGYGVTWVFFKREVNRV